MPRYKDEPIAVRVYTVCDESKYLMVRNVPALGCGNELLTLFSQYGEVEECKPMDDEECEPFTDVYWIKYCKFDNARFAKRKLDEFVFLGNRLQVSYAPRFESLSDTHEKLEWRRKEVLTRLNPTTKLLKRSSAALSPGHMVDRPLEFREGVKDSGNAVHRLSDIKEGGKASPSVAKSGDLISKPFVSSDDYFPSESMNQTVRMVRERLDKTTQQSSGKSEAEPAKKARVDNRRRI